MNERKGPRADSRACFALHQLYQYGGSLPIEQWMVAVAWRSALGVFDRQVIGPLLQHGLIIKRGANCEITGRGREFLGLTSGPAVDQVITPGTYVPPMRPLSARHYSRPTVVRDGAFYYRDIPSRHGDTRVPYKSSIAVNLSGNDDA